MHRLIPHADAVELAFVFIYSSKCSDVSNTYFYRLAWAFIAEPKSDVFTYLIFYLRYYLSSIWFDLEHTKD